MLAFSDLQAEIAADLIKNGVAVMTYNQRDVVGILAMIRHLGTTVGVGDKAEALASSYEKRLTDMLTAKKLNGRSRVYFEEWNSPMITGIKWVSELVEIAGGTDVFAALSSNAAAADRIVTSEQVIEASPDLILRVGVEKRSGMSHSRTGMVGLPCQLSKITYF